MKDLYRRIGKSGVNIEAELPSFFQSYLRSNLREKKIFHKSNSIWIDDRTEKVLNKIISFKS